jgi:methanethiol S-methyltransferase
MFGPSRRELNTMTRSAFFAYGVACHLLFLAVYAYFAGFVANFAVPWSIDSGASQPLGTAIALDLLLLLVFALQHSIMARPAFKQAWTRLVPQPIERSTYVLASCLVLMLLMWQWRPINIVLWDVRHPALWGLMVGVFAAGWLGVPLVSLMINHFDLFGTRQVWLHWQDQPYTPLPFTTPLAYSLVRHPLYVAWAMAFWATPTMTLGHLLLASVLTVYMVAASRVEERDLVAYFGKAYEDYQRSVPAFVPLGRRVAADTVATAVSSEST